MEEMVLLDRHAQSLSVNDFVVSMRIVHSNALCSHGLIRAAARPLPPSPRWRTLLTLAIETSCDDTAVAIVEKTGSAAKLLFNERITAHQGQLRGIHPILSLESHDARLGGLLQKSLSFLPDAQQESQLPDVIRVHHDGQRVKKQLPDFVSVTRGPGMRSSLSVGLSIAKGLAIAWQKPLVGVHHMQAHALTPRLVNALDDATDGTNTTGICPAFPYLSLLVSGGHTMLIKSESLVVHRILMTTSDYAIGDCLDKISRFVLPPELIAESSSPSYGPLLEAFAFPNGAHDYNYEPPRDSRQENREAERTTAYGWYVPTPFMKSRGGAKKNAMEFSFTGIEGQARRISEYGWNSEHGTFNKVPRATAMDHAEAQCLAQQVMQTAFEHMANRILQALLQEQAAGGIQSTTLVLSGGVASNSFLRHIMKAYLSARGFENVDIVAPPIALCTDNAAMIGWAGCEMWEAGHSSELDIRALSKWSLENLLEPEVERDARSWLENHPNGEA